jgi:hypothetical protein
MVEEKEEGLSSRVIFFFFEVKARPKAGPAWDTSRMSTTCGNQMRDDA